MHIRRPRSSLVVLLVLGLLLSAVGAAAGSPTAVEPRAYPLVGSNFRISGPNATGIDGGPAIAWNPGANQYLVVWHDNRNATTRGYDVYARLLDADGSPLGREFRISNRRAKADDLWPTVAYSPVKHEYLVVWQDGRRQATRGLDIFGQALTADGTKVGRNFRISPQVAKADEWSPEVVYNEVNGQYLVVWLDDRREANRGRDVYARRLATDASPLGRNIRISGRLATGDEGGASAAVNTTTGEYLIVWHDSRWLATRGKDIAGQRMAADGTLLGANIAVSGVLAVYHEEFPSVAYNPAVNQYLVVWSDHRKAVVGQHLTAAGTQVGLNFAIGEGPGTTAVPAVTYVPAANYGYLVVWVDCRYLSTRMTDLVGRRVAAGGGLVGSEFRVDGAAGTADEADFPRVVHNPTASESLVVWQDYRDRARNWDVYGQRLET